MSKYRKKPVIIEAFEWTGGLDQTEDPKWIIDAMKAGTVRINNDDGCHLFIDTLEGTHMACPGDFIIRGIKGELYPCKPDIFEQTYDQVDV